MLYLIFFSILGLFAILPEAGSTADKYAGVCYEKALSKRKSQDYILYVEPGNDPSNAVVRVERAE